MSQQEAVAFLERQAMLFPPGQTHAAFREGEETRALLRQRLAALFPVGGLIFASLLLLGLTGTDPAFARENTGVLTQGLLGVATLASFASAAVVRSRPWLSLAWLRRLELLVFGSYAAAVAGLRVSLFHQGLAGVND